MAVKIIKDGQEIDIKNLDKDFLNNLLVTFLSQVGLKEDNELLKNTVEKEENLFTKEDVNALQVIEEELVVDFSGALDALKEGYRVTRKSWVEKSKQRYLYFVPATTCLSKTHAATQEFGEGVPYSAYIALRTDLGYVTPYTITNPDLFAEDWLVISKDY